MEKQAKFEEMERFLSMLKELQATRRKMIERFASLQSEMETAGFQEISVKLGETSASASKNFEKLDAVVHDFEIERNRFKNEEM